jgi:hypothetical protein
VRKIIRIGLVLLLVAILGALAWAVLQRPEPEPVYKGKPLSYWLDGFGGGGNSGSSATLAPTYNEAHTALGQVGTNAIPFLLRQLRKGNSVLKEKCYSLLQRQQFIKIQLTPPYRHSMQAFFGLSELREKAGSAVPQLIAIYDRHADIVQREIITAVLASLGPAAKEAVPVLLRGLTDTDELVRNNSAYALGQVHADPKLVAPALIKCLHDPCSHVRAKAADSLATFGKDAQSALPALRELLSRERAAPPFTNSVPGPRNNFSTIVSYGLANRNKTRGFSPFGTPIDVIGPVEKAIQAIDPNAPITEIEMNSWLVPTFKPAR